MIQVPRDPNLQVGNSEAASSTHNDVLVFGMPNGPIEEHFDTGPHGDDSEPEDDDSSGAPLPSNPQGHNVEAHGPLFNCHFYRLRHPPLHIFLYNAAGVPMLRELARHLGVVPASLLQAHPVQAQMVGDQVGDFSFVLQSITDLPAASSDALVVLDVEVHFAQGNAGLQPIPAAARRVLRTPLHVTREAVLGFAGVQQYCRLQLDRCLVQINGRGWPILRPGPLRMQHGTYLRVIVPPPIDGTNTLNSIRLVQAPQVNAQMMAPGAAPGPAPPSSASTTGLAPAPSGTARATWPQPDDASWFRDLENCFQDQAVVEFEDEGPVLYVWTWFINHETYRNCPEAKVVRLDELRNLWLQDLLEPWSLQVQPHAVTHIAVVHARPPNDSFRIDTIHVMIEQHPSEARVAAVLSALFHGPRDDRLLQLGRSIPRWVCTEDVIDLLEIGHVCETQVCRARIGRVPMQQFIRDDLPTACSIELHVRPPRCDGHAGAASSSEPFVSRTIMPAAANSLMQITRRWQRNRLPAAAQEQPPADRLAEQHVVCSSENLAGQPVPQALLHEVGPIPLPWPTQWRTEQEVWQFFFGLHALHFPNGIQAEVWYSDHVRRPWSEEGRVVQLPAERDLWVGIFQQA